MASPVSINFLFDFLFKREKIQFSLSLDFLRSPPPRVFNYVSPQIVWRVGSIGQQQQWETIHLRRC